MSRASLAYVRPHWRLAVLVLAALSVEVAFDVLFPLGVKVLVDRVVGEGVVPMGLLAGLGGAFIASAIAGVGREYCSATLGARALSDVRAGLFDHLQGLSPGFYARSRMGDLLARFTSDLAVVESALVRALPLAAYGLLGLGASVVLIVLLEWRPAGCSWTGTICGT
jgi:ATP-binding cassette subfamily B protein